MSHTPHRFYYLDYLRGFIVLLVVLDHSMHAYSPSFKRFWYIPDFGGTLYFDLWHMHNDIIMMPMLFFLAGMFVIPSLNRRGLRDFTREKLVRLGIPFAIGTLTLVPLQTYGKYYLFRDADLSFWSYLTQVYYFDGYTLSGFWFLSLLLVLTFLLVALHKLAPHLLAPFTKLAQLMARAPIVSAALVFLIVAVLMGLSDLLWGAPWWISFTKLLTVRGSRFLTKIFLFFLGAGVSYAGLISNTSFMVTFAQRWKTWLSMALATGALYMWYSLTYMDTPGGPYNNEIRRALAYDANMAELWPLLEIYAPPVLLRTTLMAAFMLSVMATYLSLFRRFLDRAIPWFLSLGVCSYGIYIFHEPVTVWVHVLFYEAEIHELLKFITAGGASLACGWGVTAALRHFSLPRKVL